MLEAEFRQKVRQLVTDKASSMEELATFRAKALWLRNDKLTKVINRFFEPHSKKFFSTLRPLFLHQLKSNDALAYFSPVLSRDGLCSLLYYFRRNPFPPSSDVFLLINRRFAAFIPEAWRYHVGFYHVVPRAGRPVRRSDCKDVYLLLSPLGPRHCSLDYLRERLRAVKRSSVEEAQNVRFYVLAFFNQSALISGEKIDQRSRYFFELVSCVLQELGSAAEFMDWDRLLTRELEGSIFLDCNEFDLFYSESFVNQHFLSRGARSGATSGVKDPQAVEVPLSFYHSYDISIEGFPGNSATVATIQAQLTSFLRSSLYLEEEAELEGATLEAREEVPFPTSLEVLAHELMRSACATNGGLAFQGGLNEDII